jgi:hypothetical protein
MMAKSLQGASITDPQFIIDVIELASWPSGKARVCKTLTMGSNPIDASAKNGKISRFLFNHQPSESRLRLADLYPG